MYILGQLLGAFFGSLFVYANYANAIDLFEGGKGVRTVPGTASLFSSYAVSSRPEQLMKLILINASLAQFRRHTCLLQTASSTR